MSLCRLSLSGLLLVCCQAGAATLPQPLSLQDALAFASTAHPDILAQRAATEQALAQRSQVASDSAVELRLIADGRLVEPSTNNPRISRNDSRLHLTLSKRLYDFGQTRAANAAAQARLASEQQQEQVVLQQHRLQIMRDFFEVLLADLDYAVADEAMAIEFVRLDRMRQRNALGQVSDVELAEQENRYQQQRTIRYRAESLQRSRRARLAESLNRPGDLPADLVEPELKGLDREAPDIDQLVHEAMLGNPTLIKLKLALEAGRHSVQAARKAGRPVISGELTASDYAREFTTRDQLRAGLLLDMPLYTGGRVDARRAEAVARLHASEAQYARQQIEVRQALREAVERIGVLQVEREQAIAEQAFRDLDLDQARTNYELEFASDLGNSMADATAARLHRARAEYQLVLTWMEIALLTGRSDYNLLDKQR